MIFQFKFLDSPNTVYAIWPKKGEKVDDAGNDLAPGLEEGAAQL